MADNEALIKAAFQQITASHGWQYVLRFADTIIKEMESKVFNEEDDVKAIGYRRDARGARLFRETLLKRIEMAADQPTADEFLDIATD